MQKAYSRIRWENEPSVKTPLAEVNLNKMDSALDTVDTRVCDLYGYEENAAASEKAAAASEKNAKTSETNAAASEAAAKASETAAAASETNAKASETNAAASESAAATSEQNAKTSETNAATSEQNAKTSETNAKTSETNAKASETAAAASEANAATSEQNAKTSETNAADSESLARKWAVGDTGSGDETPSDTNSSYYYAKLAESYAGFVAPTFHINFDTMELVMERVEGQATFLEFELDDEMNLHVITTV